MAASQTLRSALTKAEQANPGLTFELVQGIISKKTKKYSTAPNPLINYDFCIKGKGNLNINMYESILRLQGAQQTLDCK